MMISRTICRAMSTLVFDICVFIDQRVTLSLQAAFPSSSLYSLRQESKGNRV